MIQPKLPRTTPAQSEVYWKEFDRLKSIKNRSIRLELIKRHNIRFEVDASLICVYLGDNLVICVGNRKGAYRLVNNYLFTMYQTLWAMERGYSHVK